MLRKILRVVIEASDRATLEQLIDGLARSACDVANSTEDDEAHIFLEDDDPAPNDNPFDPESPEGRAWDAGDRTAVS